MRVSLIFPHTPPPTHPPAHKQTSRAAPPPPPPVPPEVVTIEVDFDGTLIWNGRVVPNRQELEERLRAAAEMPVQPEGHLRPNKLVKYESVAMVMASAQRLGLKKIGPIGNEQFMRCPGADPRATCAAFFAS